MQSRSFRLAVGLLCMTCLDNGLAAAEEEKGKVIAASEARKHVDQTLTVEMTVESSRLLADRGLCFLNSQKDFRDERNFTAVLLRSVLDKLKADGVADPVTHYQGKKLKVNGKITLYEGRPQIRVEDSKQIELIKDAAKKETK